VSDPARAIPPAPASETRFRDPDDELAARAAAGDREAFGELARGARPRVHRMALRLTDNADEAEDVTQETFARLLERLPPVAFEPGAFVRYACTVARSICLDRRRAEIGRSGRGRRHVDVDDLELAADVASADDELERHEARVALRRDVEALAPGMRRVVLLLLEGLSNVEVAAALGITKGGVGAHVSRATEQLAVAARGRGWGAIGARCN